MLSDDALASRSTNVNASSQVHFDLSPVLEIIDDDDNANNEEIMKDNMNSSSSQKESHILIPESNDRQKDKVRPEKRKLVHFETAKAPTKSPNIKKT